MSVGGYKSNNLQRADVTTLFATSEEKTELINIVTSQAEIKGYWSIVTEQ